MGLAREVVEVARMAAGLALLHAGSWLVKRDTRVSPAVDAVADAEDDDGEPHHSVVITPEAQAMIAAPAPRQPRPAPPPPLPGSIQAQLQRRG